MFFISSENFEVSPSTPEYFETGPSQSELIRPRTRRPVRFLSLPLSCSSVGSKENRINIYANLKGCL